MLLQFAQKALIVNEDRVLLVRKAKDDPHNPGRWELPGGRLKQNESLDAALQRVVMEVVGLTVVPGRPLALWSWRLVDGDEAPTVVAVARVCTVEGADVSLGENQHGREGRRGAKAQRRMTVFDAPLRLCAYAPSMNGSR